jgi:hypothetical protein
MGIPVKDTRWKAGASSSELKEMEEILQAHGYDPKDAKALQAEGMGTFELEHRIKSTKPGGIGSLEYTHRLKKVKHSAADWKVATSPQQWDAAAEILEQKEEHAAIKLIKNGFAEVLKAIDEADKRSKNMKRIGVGRTEDPTMILVHVEPAIRGLGEECLHIAKQMKERFSGV